MNNALVIFSRAVKDVDFVVTDSDREEIYNFVEKNPSVTAIKLFKNASAYGRWMYDHDYSIGEKTREVFLGDFADDFNFERFGKEELKSDDEVLVLRSGAIVVVEN